MEYEKFVRFSNENDTCAPGKVLQGDVVLTLNKPRKYKGIHVLISGYAEVEWKEKEKKEVNGSTKKKRESYKGKKIYFENMIGVVDYNVPVELSAGTHNFPFAYQLPDSLPPAIKGVHGHCTYTAKVVLDRPWRPNETVKKNFNVQTKYVIPAAMLAPAFEQCVEDLWLLPFKTTPFKLNVELGQRAFQVGDGIPVSVQMEHESNTTIYEIKFQLRQIVQFFSETPTRKCKEEFNKILDIRCKVMDSRKIGKFHRVLQIPHLPVTYTSISDLLNVVYEVRVEVKVGGLNRNPSVRMPVVIGTSVDGVAPVMAAAAQSGRAIGFVVPNDSIVNLSMVSGVSIGSSGGWVTMNSSSCSQQQEQQQQRPQNEVDAAPPSYNDAVVSSPTTVKH